MNSAVDLSTNSVTISPQTRAEEARSRTTVTFWIALALVGLATIGCGIAGSYYTNVIDAPYVGP